MDANELDELKANMSIMLQTAPWFKDLVYAAVQTEIAAHPIQPPVVNFGPSPESIESAKNVIFSAASIYGSDDIKRAVMDAIVKMCEVKNVTITNCTFTAK